MSELENRVAKQLFHSIGGSCKSFILKHRWETTEEAVDGCVDDPFRSDYTMAFTTIRTIAMVQNQSIVNID